MSPIHVSIRVTTLDGTDNGYLWQMCGLPDQDDEYEHCLDPWPRLELYGRLWTALRDLSADVSVTCEILGQRIEWPWKSQYLFGVQGFGVFLRCVDQALKTDQRSVAEAV